MLSGSGVLQHTARVVHCRRGLRQAGSSGAGGRCDRTRGL
jgi:hypothetical protein